MNDTPLRLCNTDRAPRLLPPPGRDEQRRLDKPLTGGALSRLS